MTDLLIAKSGDTYDLVIEGGDLVLTSTRPRVEQVAQRVIYRIMTWLGESPYDRSAGVPYLEGIFGKQPLQGAVFILVKVVRETDGVDDIVGEPTFELNPQTRGLTLAVTIRVGNEVAPIELAVAA